MRDVENVTFYEKIRRFRSAFNLQVFKARQIGKHGMELKVLRRSLNFFD